MDRGRLLEMGSPLELLDRGPGGSAFADMVQALGKEAAAAIRHKALGASAAAEAAAATGINRTWLYYSGVLRERKEGGNGVKGVDC